MDPAELSYSDRCQHLNEKSGPPFPASGDIRSFLDATSVYQDCPGLNQNLNQLCPVIRVLADKTFC
jgi:hypothetical protein